jgi:hypothetical protein
MMKQQQSAQTLNAQQGGNGGPAGMQQNANVAPPGSQYPGQGLAGGSSAALPTGVQHNPMQNAQNPMFSSPVNGGQGAGMGLGMDARAMQAMQQNANINNLTQQQRQQLMLMQQSSMRAGGSNNSMMSMNPQGTQQEQQRLSQKRLPNQGNSPSNTSSMSLPNDSYSLRSNPTVPGIARSTRSPSESAPSPSTRGPSMNQDDYQRAMMQAQQMQASRGMGTPQLGGNPNFNTQMQASMGWPQQQQQPQQGMQMQGAMDPNYPMSPPRSAGHGGSPHAGGSSPGTWPHNTQGMGGGTYPFDNDRASASRHTSATPAPQMMQPLQNMSLDQGAPGEVDFFNWGR